MTGGTATGNGNGVYLSDPGSSATISGGEVYTKKRHGMIVYYAAKAEVTGSARIEGSTGIKVHGNDGPELTVTGGTIIGTRSLNNDLWQSGIYVGNVENVKQYSASNPPPYPVTSVNGKTGAVSVSVPTALSGFTNDIYNTVAVVATYEDGTTETLNFMVKK